MSWIDRRWALQFFALWSVCGLAGCSESGPEFFQVTGTVTFDAKPLSAGDIIFLPNDPTQTATGGTITDGKYSVKALAGEYRVQINASREVPGKKVKGVDGKDVPIFQNYVPKRYNEKTELTAKVLSSASSDVNFDLKSM